jgi:putative ABC transport system permease protein
MYISDLLRRSSRSIKAAKARTLLTALAIAVGAFSLTLTLAASNGTQNFIGQVIQDNFNPAELIVSNDDRVLGGESDLSQPLEYDPSFGTISSQAGADVQVRRITTEDIERIEQVDRIESVRRNISVNLQYLTRDNEKKFVATVAPFDEYRKPDLLAGEISRPLGGDEILLPEAWLDSLGFDSAEKAIGESVTLVLRPTIQQQGQLSNSRSENFQLELRENAGSSGEELTGPTFDYTISAVLESQSTAQPGTELYLFMSDQEAVRLNEIQTEGTDDFGRFIFVYAQVEDGKDNSILMEAQEELRDLGYTVQSVQDTQDFLNQIISVLQGIVVAFGAIAVLASVFGIINTMYISVLQRTGEIGLLKALGMHSRDVGRLFRLEAAWIGFLGGIIGSAGAILTGVVLNPWISQQLDLGEGNFLLLFEWTQIAGLIAVLIAISIVAGWLPSRKAAKLDPIEALRTE